MILKKLPKFILVCMILLISISAIAQTDSTIAQTDSTIVKADSTIVQTDSKSIIEPQVTPKKVRNRDTTGLWSFFWYIYNCYKSKPIFKLAARWY